MSRPSDSQSLDPVAQTVRRIVASQAVWDVHTHLYPPTLGSPLAGAGREADPQGLLLWGIDELLTYHYLVAELFRVVSPERLSYATFWRMSKREQADLIWQRLFWDRSPVSEACRGVLSTLTRFGLDPNEPTLDRYRRWFAAQDLNRHIDRVMELAGIERITMTNNVFDDHERRRWLDGSARPDRRFAGVLRIDRLLRDWPGAAAQLAAWGYQSDADLGPRTLAELRRFLADWIDRLTAVYCAASLPPEFCYAGQDDARPHAIVLREALLPLLSERGLPLAMMIGCRAAVNPALGDAGDMVGKADIASVTRLCAEFPENRFLVTLLSRENQHELAVLARKFGNLTIFGCWWFLNTPSLIAEITRMRLELLGTSFIPQHSDARVLEQLVYKWDHSRQVMADVLADQYRQLAATGWTVSEEAVARDVRRLLRDNAARMSARDG
ncbi:MAG: glucuronate isomerase [Candidatus Anammoximicrobium sp.]|nr:glucuronate isomerase [Candidatus Anammoximicrobium sp.]